MSRRRCSEARARDFLSDSQTFVTITITIMFTIIIFIIIIITNITIIIMARARDFLFSENRINNLILFQKPLPLFGNRRIGKRSRKRRVVDYASFPTSCSFLKYDFCVIFMCLIVVLTFYCFWVFSFVSPFSSFVILCFSLIRQFLFVPLFLYYFFFIVFSLQPYFMYTC